MDNVEAPTMPRKSPDESPVKAPSSINREGAHASPSVPQGRANSNEEHFNESCGVILKAGDDVEAPTRLRVSRESPPFTTPVISNKDQDARESLIFSQGGAIYSEDSLTSSGVAMQKADVYVEALVQTREALVSPRGREPTISYRAEPHQSSGLVHGDASAGQDLTHASWEGMQSSTSLLHDDSHASSNASHRRGLGQKAKSKRRHRHHRPKDDIGQDEDAEFNVL